MPLVANETSEPLRPSPNCKLPALTVVAPEYVMLEPVRVSVLAPTLVSPSAWVMLPL